MITVFYDEKCSLCSKEIGYYRTIAPNGVFIWKDVTTSVDILKKEGVTLVDGLKLLHAMDENKVMHVGVDAFILIWRHLKGWRFIAKLTSLPIVRQVTNITYKAFASWRFKKLAHCQFAKNNEV